VGGQLQLGSGQVLVTGNGGGISKRARNLLPWFGVLDNSRVGPHSRYVRPQWRANDGARVGRTLIEWVE
jgi:hypothetical protein